MYLQRAILFLANNNPWKNLNNTKKRTHELTRTKPEPDYYFEMAWVVELKYNRKISSIV